MTIGRDLIRLLQGVARVPEVEKLWKDILHNPSSLSPTFTGVKCESDWPRPKHCCFRFVLAVSRIKWFVGIHQLMQMRTSRRLIASLLTPDMENKLGFLMSKVESNVGYFFFSVHRLFVVLQHKKQHEHECFFRSDLGNRNDIKTGFKDNICRPQRVSRSGAI